MAPADAFWRDPRLGTPGRVELSAGTVDYHSFGSGPALLFVHGYLVNANIWRKLVPLLGDTYRCITPDWPLGSHRTALRVGADMTPRGVGGLIAEFAERTGLDDVTLIGNDSGGAYAQIAAAHHPDRFARLVLNSCETASAPKDHTATLSVSRLATLSSTPSAPHATCRVFPSPTRQSSGATPKAATPPSGQDCSPTATPPTPAWSAWQPWHQPAT